MTEISYASIAKKKKLKRGLMLATLFAVAAAVTVFSSNDTEQSEVSTSPNKSNTLSISGPWEISSLDPSKQGYILTRMQVIETLLNVDSQGVITPGLATHWRSSDDGLSWHFVLRKGVKFHDGSELDAKAVVKSLAYAQRKIGRAHV